MQMFSSINKNANFWRWYKIAMIAFASLWGALFLLACGLSSESGVKTLLLVGVIVWMALGIFQSFRNRSLGEGFVHIIVYAIFTAFALSYLYIFFWGTTSGFKTHTEIAIETFKLPNVWHFRNYIDVFSRLQVAGFGFFGMLMNSLYFSLFGSFILCMMASMLAYVTNKFRFPGSRLFMPVLLFTMMLPIYGSGGSMYKLLLNLGLVNSYAQILLSFNGMTVYYLYFSATYSNLSWNFAEAAYIDGAGDYTVYFKVMFPQVINLFGALFLITWVGDWNNYSSALIYLTKLPTLAGGIYMFELNMVQHARRDLLYAAYMITAIPPLFLFIFFNKVLTSNISLGGIKE